MFLIVDQVITQMFSKCPLLVAYLMLMILLMAVRNLDIGDISTWTLRMYEMGIFLCILTTSRTMLKLEGE